MLSIENIITKKIDPNTRVNNLADAELLRSRVERIEDWRVIEKQIPYLQFKPEWEIRMRPPFAGAIARFLVQYKNAQVSVYLDWYSRLGSVDEPYWEIYPYKRDVRRYLLNDTKKLIRGIQTSINQQLKKK